jgi:hypothetical protein
MIITLVDAGTTYITIAQPWDVAACDRPPNDTLQLRRCGLDEARRASARDAAENKGQVEGCAAASIASGGWAGGRQATGADVLAVSTMGCDVRLLRIGAGVRKHHLLGVGSG